MNVKEYIQSGIVESYVLGLATDAERQEFERMCVDYPEITAARDSFERSLEEQLLQDAVVPPAFLKERIFETLKPSVKEDGFQQKLEETPVRRMNVWKWIAAASLILLAGAAFWAYSTNEKYNDLSAKQAAIQEQLAQKNNELATMKADAQMLYKPGMKMVSLKGTQEAPQAYTTVYWDTTGASKDVYLMINNLPQPPSEKQYQLWALLDGQPIDLGVFDYDVREKRLLVRMKNVQNAQAFAITLERRGRPNQEKPEGQIYVVGNL
ncbi:MAG: anti-sigma factor [Chitinophagaceae bacterium]|nr:MAG: anti-sigma factor [Chitinophagaceae bacterium]